MHLPLLIQHAARICYVVTSFVAPLSPPNFLTSHKWYDFRKNVLNIKCVLIFSTTFVKIISHSKKNLVRYYHKYEYIFT
jgi:hypothetical protein